VPGESNAWSATPSPDQRLVLHRALAAPIEPGPRPAGPHSVRLLRSPEDPVLRVILAAPVFSQLGELASRDPGQAREVARPHLPRPRGVACSVWRTSSPGSEAELVTAKSPTPSPSSRNRRSSRESTVTVTAPQPRRARRRARRSRPRGSPSRRTEEPSSQRLRPASRSRRRKERRQRLHWLSPSSECRPATGSDLAMGGSASQRTPTSPARNRKS
jgi:hypothetical protein